MGFEVQAADSLLRRYSVSVQRVAYISKDYSALIFRVKQSKKIKLLDLQSMSIKSFETPINICQSEPRKFPEELNI